MSLNFKGDPDPSSQVIGLGGFGLLIFLPLRILVVELELDTFANKQKTGLQADNCQVSCVQARPHVEKGQKNKNPRFTLKAPTTKQGHQTLLPTCRRRATYETEDKSGKKN